MTSSSRCDNTWVPSRRPSSSSTSAGATRSPAMTVRMAPRSSTGSVVLCMMPAAPALIARAP